MTPEEAEVRVNLVCLAGAILGIACVFLPWAVVTESLVGDSQAHVVRTVNIAPVDLLDISLYPDFAYLMYAAILFAIGSAVAAFTPFGGISQLAGIVIFDLELKDSLPHLLPISTIIPKPGFTSEYSSSFGPYIYLAILAATLTLASFAVSVRIDVSREIRPKASLSMPIRERLLAIGADFTKRRKETKE